MGQSDGLGNQQATVSDLSWLGGILDGEGSFTIGATRDQKQRVHLRPEIHIGNTSVQMFEEIKRILALHHLPAWVGMTPAGTGRGKHTLQRDCYRVYARGPKRVQRWLDVVAPYVRAKQHEAITLGRFVASRLAKATVMPYSDEEFGWYMELRSLHGNRKRESPETIREAISQQRPGAPKGNLNAVGGR